MVSRNVVEFQGWKAAMMAAFFVLLFGCVNQPSYDFGLRDVFGLSHAGQLLTMFVRKRDWEPTRAARLLTELLNPRRLFRIGRPRSPGSSGC